MAGSDGHKTPGPAKVSRPRPVKIYARTRLFRRLEPFDRRPVVWISGPPGAGKTTLAASYLDSRDITPIWQQLDRGDGDAATFFYYLGLAAADANAAAPLPHLTPERRTDLEVFTRRYFEQLYSGLNQPFAIVFDNYHAIPRESEVHQVFRWGLEQIPGGGRVIIISRSAPPNSFSWLESSLAMAFLDSEDLKLSLQEAKGIAGLYRRWHKGRHLIPALHERTEGWAAGLVLMLEHVDHPRSSAVDVTSETRDNRFRYFGGEVFDRMDASTRDALLKTALLPNITEDLAVEITGDDQAGRIIAGMHERNYFTERVLDPEPVYRYHPLFREFLLTEVEERLAPDALTALRCRAVEVLEHANRLEEAAEICQQGRDWEGLARLCLKLAADLVAQGRTNTLKEWLQLIVGEGSVSDPWIKYWLAHVELPHNPDRAADMFEEAHAGFSSQDNKKGLLSAWCGVVDAIVYSWNNFRRLDSWITWLEHFEHKDGTYPSSMVEAWVTVSMFSALMFRRPQHPDIHNWADRGLTLVRQTGDPVPLIRMVELQSHFYFWIGELDRAGQLLDEIDMYLAKGPVPIIVLLGSRMQKAIYFWHVAEFDAAIEAVDDGLDLGKRQGVHILDGRLAAQGVYASIGAGKLDDAQKYLELMGASLSPGRHLDLAHYHNQRGWLAICRGDFDTARREIEHATIIAEEMGTPFPIALGCINFARMLDASGDRSAAAQRLAMAREIGEAMGSNVLRYQVSLVSAEVALEDGDRESCLASLREGLEIARRNQYWMSPTWVPAMMAQLCAYALDHDIESQFVRRLIQLHNLTPPQNRPPGPQWPWPIRIHALGGFYVAVDGETVQFERKAQLRPMELLQVVIALGGYNVNERRLADVLWPDSEGDAGLQSLATTLHRARKLLRRDDAIIRREGKISLNARCCWIDALAFGERIESLSALDPHHWDIEWLTDSLTLYTGPFLGEHNDSAWSIALRERLEGLFTGILAELAGEKEREGALTEAISWYQFGIERAPASETLYRGLIHCRINQGETTAAIATYRRCENALNMAHGLKPSAQTRELASKLLQRG